MKTKRRPLPLTPSPKKGGGAGRGAGRPLSGFARCGASRTASFSPSLLRGGGWGERFFLPALALLAALGGAVGAAPPVAPPPHAARPALVAPAVNDSFEVLVFTDARPVRIRISVRYEGKPPGEVWLARLRALFDYCDRDGDGSLDAKEAAFVFSYQNMNQLLRSGSYQAVGAHTTALAQLDQDRDAKVSFAELTAYYQAAAADLVRVQPGQPENPQTAAVTEAIFKTLDANADGKLTKAEVKAAEKLLATRDADEDECLNVQEFAPDLYNPNFGRTPPRISGRDVSGVYPIPDAAQTVVVYETGKVPGTVTQQVVKKYDADGDLKLTKAECGFDAATFKALDADADGKLSGEELDVWRTGAPDLSVTLSLAPKPDDCTATLADAKAATARGFALRQTERGRLVLQIGRQTVDLSAFAVSPQYERVALKQNFAYLFARAAGGKAYVVEKNLNGPNAVQFQYLRVIFDPADRDADGKLTRAEFDTYFDLLDGFISTSLSLSPAVQTPTLFQLLDENRDGRLGVRELRTAWDRLIVLEAPGAEVVTTNVVRPAVSVRLSRTRDRSYSSQPPAYPNPDQITVPTKGPLWFRKMDRNGDGDVSRGEFVGTRAEFDAIDTDADDLISLSEAEAYDKRARDKGKKGMEATPKPGGR